MAYGEFQRQPPASNSAREILIETSGVALSGLLAEPASGEEPRALIVALHGAGMHAGYFHATSAPGLSLLDLASGRGYAVWAPDRPGIGASAHLPDERITLFAQASLLLDAIEQYSSSRSVGAGVMLVAHSYGLKVAWAMAADSRRQSLLGIDGVGSGVDYISDWSPRPRSQPALGADDDRGDGWGPAALYPDNTFERGILPLHPMPAAQAAESPRWPEDIRAMASRIRVPTRLTYGEHERFWPTDGYHLRELRSVFENVPGLSIEFEPSAGHNISLGWRAPAYHLKVLQFLESCAARCVYPDVHLRRVPLRGTLSEVCGRYRRFGMHIGMYVDMRNAPEWRKPSPAHYGRWLERIAEAERLGADAVWLTEHHFFDDGYLPQCWTFAAAIAARTSRMRIGTAVALLPLHSSLELAEQIALVDIISGGRVEPGFGVGYRKPEYLAFGGDFKHRYTVFADRIHELRSLWGEEPGATRLVTPPPVQDPIPMWGGFGGPMGARMAGRLGLGLQSIDRTLYEEYLTGIESAGHDPSTARMAGSLEFVISDDPEKTWAEIEEHVVYRWNSYNRYMFEGTSREAEPPQYFDTAAVSERFVIGTPEHVASVIKERSAGLPVTDIYSWSDYPGISDDMIDRQIELTFTKLAPLLR